MEKWQIEAQRIAKDIEATREQLGSDAPKFVDALKDTDTIAELLGAEYDMGYDGGYEDGENSCE